MESNPLNHEVGAPVEVPDAANDPLRPPGGEKYDDPSYEEFGLTADHVCRMWARYVDQTHPPPPEIARLIVGVTSDVYRAALVLHPCRPAPDDVIKQANLVDKE